MPSRRRRQRYIRAAILPQSRLPIGTPVFDNSATRVALTQIRITQPIEPPIIVTAGEATPQTTVPISTCTAAFRGTLQTCKFSPRKIETLPLPDGDQESYTALSLPVVYHQQTQPLQLGSPESPPTPNHSTVPHQERSPRSEHAMSDHDRSQDPPSRSSKGKGKSNWLPLDYFNTESPSYADCESRPSSSNSSRPISRVPTKAGLQIPDLMPNSPRSQDDDWVFQGRRNRKGGAAFDSVDDSSRARQTTVEASFNKREMNDVFGNELPGPEYMNQNVGFKDGQLQFAQHPNGDISAHQWSTSRYTWENIGQFSNIRKKVEGQLAADRLKGETADQSIQSNTLSYFRTIAKQREAKVMNVPFGCKEIQALMTEHSRVATGRSTGRKDEPIDPLPHTQKSPANDQPVMQSVHKVDRPESPKQFASFAKRTHQTNGSLDTLRFVQGLDYTNFNTEGVVDNSFQLVQQDAARRLRGSVYASHFLPLVSQAAGFRRNAPYNSHYVAQHYPLDWASVDAPTTAYLQEKQWMQDEHQNVPSHRHSKSHAPYCQFPHGYGFYHHEPYQHNLYYQGCTDLGRPDRSTDQNQTLSDSRYNTDGYGESSWQMQKIAEIDSQSHRPAAFGTIDRSSLKQEVIKFGEAAKNHASHCKKNNNNNNDNNNSNNNNNNSNNNNNTMKYRSVLRDDAQQPDDKNNGGTSRYDGQVQLPLVSNSAMDDTTLPASFLPGLGGWTHDRSLPTSEQTNQLLPVYEISHNNESDIKGKTQSTRHQNDTNALASWGITEMDTLGNLTIPFQPLLPGPNPNFGTNRSDSNLRKWFLSSTRFQRQEEYTKRLMATSKDERSGPTTPFAKPSHFIRCSSTKDVGVIGGSSGGSPSTDATSSSWSSRTRRLSPPLAQVVRLWIPIYENLASYKEDYVTGRHDYWSRWDEAPEWAVDRSSGSSNSFYREDWVDGSPPSTRSNRFPAQRTVATSWPQDGPLPLYFGSFSTPQGASNIGHDRFVAVNTPSKGRSHGINGFGGCIGER